MCCAIALVLISCVSKEPDTDKSPVPDYAMSTVKANAIPSLGDMEILWENRDEIAFRYQSDAEAVPTSSVYTTSLAAPKATAVFKKSSGELPNKVDGKYIAIYPSSLDYLEWGTEPYVMLAPNANQIVKNKKIDRASSIMVAACEGPDATFAHVVSYIRFTVTSATSQFYKVTVASGDSSQYMTSRIKVNFDEAFSYDLLTYDSAGKTYTQTQSCVSLTTSDKSSFAPGSYLIAINPDTYEEGLKVTFENRPGSIATIEYSTPFVAGPGDVIDLGEVCSLDFKVSSQFYPQTEVGNLLKGELAEKIVDVMWDTTYNVTKGLDYYQMRVRTDVKEELDIYLMRTDMSQGLDIKVAVSSASTPSEWYTQTLTEMAARIDSETHPVYAMLNADFCDNRPPIRPRGPVHMDGEVWCSTYSLDPEYTQQGLSYVGVTDEGKMVIGTRAEYEYDKSFLRECTGAGVILIQNSTNVSWGTSRDPRTGIGYTSENIVWMLAVDGRHKGTEGMTYQEMASIFMALGCEAAVNLDGGGSTEMIVRNPRTGVIEICNWPSDPTNGTGGQERPRPNAWAVVKK